MPLKNQTREQGAQGIRRQEHAVDKALIGVSQVMHIAWHLCLVTVAHKERGCAGQEQHAQKGRVKGDVSEGGLNVCQSLEGTPRGDRHPVVDMAIRGLPKPRNGGDVKESIEHHALNGTHL